MAMSELHQEITENLATAQQNGFLPAPFDNEFSTLRFIPSLWGVQLKPITLNMMERYM